MTIKKNTLIIICSVIITLIISFYFINNIEVIQFKDNSLLAKNHETNDNKLETENLDNLENEIITESTSDSNNVIKDNNTTSSSPKINVNKASHTSNEEDVLTYFRLLEADTKKSTKDSSLHKVKDVIDNAFFTTVDFIFYDTEIKGFTFKQLSNAAKVEILEIASRIDSMISKKFPTYKETIKDKGNKVYGLISEQIDSLKTKIKNEIGDEKYNKVTDFIEKGKDKLGDLKDSTFNVTGNAWDKLKNWYENKRENRD